MITAFEEPILQPKFRWLLAFVLITIALMFNTTANASQVEKIIVQAASQQVDTDGDGRLEAFSADYTVYADGTAVGEFNLDDDYKIIVESGSIEVGPNGELTVEVQGESLEQEIGHELGFSYAPSTPANGGGNGGNDGIDIILFDIVDAAGHANSFDSTVFISIR